MLKGSAYFLIVIMTGK